MNRFNLQEKLEKIEKRAQLLAKGESEAQEKAWTARPARNYWVLR